MPPVPDPPQSESLTIRVEPTGHLGPAIRREVVDLFRSAYEEADEAHLERSLALFRFLAMATDGGRTVGFALGDMRVADLPRLPGQAVALAGICCVDSRYRRRGLFLELEQAAFSAAGVPPQPRLLCCGRVAHPASMRTIALNETCVPRRGVVPSAWQQEVGAAVAALYGVTRFEPRTFVCVGGGHPIGFPQMQIDVSPQEWELFHPVDRARGDSLLALCWLPDAPEGWNPPDERPA